MTNSSPNFDVQQAILKNFKIIRHLPDEVLSKDLIQEVLKKDYRVAIYIPDRHWTPEVCTAAQEILANYQDHCDELERRIESFKRSRHGEA